MTAPRPDEMRYEAGRGEVRRHLDAAIGRSGLPGPLQEAIRYGSTAPEASRWRALLVVAKYGPAESRRRIEACVERAAAALEPLAVHEIAAQPLQRIALTMLGRA